MRHPLRHLIVLIPGIGGSVLSDERGTVWGSGRALFGLLGGSGEARARLTLTRQNGHPAPKEPLTPVGVLPDIGIIPGLVRVNGYRLTSRWISARFHLTEGPGANYREFPYDWRLDNRLNGRRLHRAVSEWLRAHRARTGDGGAKVIIIAHSMGGLIARHHLEVLGGWRDCAALITLGTPHRGSVRAVDALANGFPLVRGMAELLRTFPSVYQLLPIYPVVKDGEGHRRVAETEIPGIDPESARDGLAFHRELEAAERRNADDDTYLREHVLLPVIGTHQHRTLQSVSTVNGRVRCDPALPHSVVPPSLAGGDGTVPRISALPLTCSPAAAVCVPETHGALQLPHVLTSRLLDLLLHLQFPGLREIRGPAAEAPAEEAAVSLEIDDVFAESGPVRLRARALGFTEPPGHLSALVTGDEGRSWQLPMRREVTGPGYSGELRLAAGAYRVTVSAVGGFPPLGPLHDVFAVVADAP